MRPVPGYPGYHATDDGRIWSTRPYRGTATRWLRPSVTKNGYQTIHLSRDGRSVTRTVHTVIAETFHGPRPEGREVRHLNGNRLDNRAVNLSWGTSAENSADTVAHGNHRNSQKTHCPAGHPYAGDNLYVNPKGRRECRACHRERTRERRKRTCTPA